MDGLPSTHVTADKFIEWSLAQPKGRRYELSHGKIIEMASERLRHALAKHAVARRLEEAIERAGLPCQVYPDGMAVRIDDLSVYEPDAAVRCGEKLDLDTVIYTDPVIIVEVASPSTQSLDAIAKLAGYFRLPSVQHYLIIRPTDDQPFVIHHQRMPNDEILTRIVREGALTLDPPGITLDIATLFP